MGLLLVLLKNQDGRTVVGGLDGSAGAGTAKAHHHDVGFEVPNGLGGLVGPGAGCGDDASGGQQTAGGACGFDELSAIGGCKIHSLSSRHVG